MQHELGLAADDGIRHLVEQSQGEVSRADIIQNLASREDQLTNGSTPWQGPHENSVLLMQMLIEACSSPWDIILDCTAATNMSL